MTKPRVPRHPAPDVPQRDNTADADADAFAQEMRDVARLRPDLRGRVGRARRNTALPAPHPAGTPDEDRAAGDLDAFVAPGVDRRELRRLKRGDHPAVDQLDLHGLTAAEACTRVDRFLERSRHRGYRSVCIVHGRGLHSESGIAVLKTRVRGYLRSHRAVLAFSDAPRSQGGAGAVYVLLRK
jgi:DNA-nicking Smr family endonuclease